MDRAGKFYHSENGLLRFRAPVGTENRRPNMKRSTSFVLAGLTLLHSHCSWAALVTSTADNGPGSLREAIASAAPGDTLTFAVTGAITLTSGELLITTNLTITGPGAN